MGQILINVPDEIAEYAPDLQYFMQTMVQKLHTNRHKGFCTNNDLPASLNSLSAEVDETYEAVVNGGQFECFVECADVANQAWLVGLVATRMTRRDWDEHTNGRRDVAQAATAGARATVDHSSND